MILSRKAEQISASITLEITALAKKMKDEGSDVIDFGVGEPDFNTPKYIQHAAIDALNKGYTRYTPTSGIMELKNAIINKFKKDNNLNYKASQIIISTGAKQCLSNTFQAILNPGDEVIVPLPYWVSYPELIKLSDGIPVFANTQESNNFKYTKEELEKVVTDKTKAILINSPNNPTGTVYTEDELRMFADFAKEKDIFIISDEIYEKLTYNEVKHVSIASLSEDAYHRTIVINGVSKTYAMTGWRLGYTAASEEIIKLMSNIQSHTTSNANSITQYAAVAALNGDTTTINSMVLEFKNRRDYMVERINSIKKLSCVKPEGAFYVMVNISQILKKELNGVVINDSLDFSKHLLEEEKVAVVPGDGFGVSNFIRLSYATSMESILEGLNRIEKFMKSFN
ncbi:MAG: pyridoxal phosphate-dependent aminotransferase [Clostridiaceae bacterium]|nr:pyridoxal phosphate-dependent aminotransferase [Clostridiaceae bacterium]